MKRKILLSFLFVLLIPAGVVYAATGGVKTYLQTTVHYYNTISINSTYWTAGVNSYTDPAFNLDDYDVVVWTTYTYCDGSYFGYVTGSKMGSGPFIYYTRNGSKYSCSTSKYAFNYAQYWWKESIFAGDGAIASISRYY